MKHDQALREYGELFEEMADVCETLARSLRALRVLMPHANADVLSPHFETLDRAFASLAPLAERVAEANAKFRKGDGR